jgi:hypothetical protein
MSTANRFDAVAHLIPRLEFRGDQPVLAERETIREFRRERGLAERRQPGQLALVPQPAKPARFGRERVSIREARTGHWRKEPAIITIEALELASLERAHAVADIVADTVRGVDQRVVPIREKQGRERMRLVMVDKAHRNIRAKAVFCQKTIRPKETQSVLDPEPATQVGDVALDAFTTELPLPSVVQIVDQRKAIVLGREIAAHKGDGVDVGANPAGRS